MAVWPWPLCHAWSLCQSCLYYSYCCYLEIWDFHSSDYLRYLYHWLLSFYSFPGGEINFSVSSCVFFFSELRKICLLDSQEHWHFSYTRTQQRENVIIFNSCNTHSKVKNLCDIFTKNVFSPQNHPLMIFWPDSFIMLCLKKTCRKIPKYTKSKWR